MRCMGDFTDVNRALAFGWANQPPQRLR